MNLRSLIFLLLLPCMIACNVLKTTYHATGRNLDAFFSSPEKVAKKIKNPIREDARLGVLWIGHATCLIQIDDKFILTDPNLKQTVGQFSKRLTEPGLDPQNIPDLDIVLISHMHIDHLSLGSLDLIESKIAHLLVPQQGLVYIPNYGFAMSELATWRHWEEDGLKVTAVPAIHNSWRYGLDDAWMKLSYTGYIIQYNGITVYFAGDTAYRRDVFSQIKQKFSRIDLALVPIAPINPREYSQARHTDPAEAVQIYNDLNSRYLIPIHYGTFSESLDQPGEAVQTMRQVMDVNNLDSSQVHILGIGEQKIFISGDKRWAKSREVN